MSELNKINKKQIFVKKHLSNYLIGDSIKPSTGNVTGNVTDNVTRKFPVGTNHSFIMKERGISK